MDKWFDKEGERWLALPIKKQHQYTMYFFTTYLLLTACVIFNIWYEIGKSENDLFIEHFENPLRKKEESPAVTLDTISTMFKNKIYERK